MDTHLGGKEVSTNALLKNETMKEEITETNTKVVERIRSRSNKICVREDLAKEKMMFSEESSQAIFEMGNVELIELKTSRIQCPSCSTLRFQRNDSLRMWQAYQTRPGNETTYQSSF